MSASFACDWWAEWRRVSAWPRMTFSAAPWGGAFVEWGAAVRINFLLILAVGVITF